MARHHTLVVLLAIAFCTVATPAHGYPWMIRHGYTACATCHTDPSGAGLLTPYGRGQSSILLSTKYSSDGVEEPGRTSEFLLGLVALPDWLQLQSWFRLGQLWNVADSRVIDSRILPMRSDLGAHVRFGQFRASATMGYNTAGATTLSERAWITGTSSKGNLVSREHWVGVSLGDDAWLVRGGRINLPFGIRNIEHTSWARNETRTDINQSQQHGIALAYTGEALRGELMAIAGNYQVHPDAYRERGYSGFLEYSPFRYASLGISSLLTHASRDILTQRRTTRQAHGLFVRAVPMEPLVILGELDALMVAATGEANRIGYTGLLQFDFEPWQGVHGIATSEVLYRGGPSEHPHTGWWLSIAWFPLPHVDARFDTIWRTAVGMPNTLTYLMQLQVYL